MKIKILEKEIELKNTFRSYIIFESITGKSFTPNNLTDILTYFFSVIIASDTTFELDFEAFINWLDSNPTALTDFTDWLVAINRKEQIFNDKTTEPVKKKQAKRNNRTLQAVSG